MTDDSLKGTPEEPASEAPTPGVPEPEIPAEPPVAPEVPAASQPDVAPEPEVAPEAPVPPVPPTEQPAEAQAPAPPLPAPTPEAAPEPPPPAAAPAPEAPPVAPPPPYAPPPPPPPPPGPGAYAGQQYVPPQPQAQPCPKSKVAAGVLGIIFGGIGVHKFYLGYTTEGLIMLAITVLGWVITGGLASGLMSLIGLIEGIIYLTKSDDDFCSTYVYNKKGWF